MVVYQNVVCAIDEYDSRGISICKTMLCGRYESEEGKFANYQIRGLRR